MLVPRMSRQAQAPGSTAHIHGRDGRLIETGDYVMIQSAANQYNFRLSVTLAIKRFSRPKCQRYACVASFPVPVASTALTILAQRLLYSSGRRDQTLCDKFSRMVPKCAVPPAQEISAMIRRC